MNVSEIRKSATIYGGRG